MKGLLKVLSPFAPDQSGAASVFYDMGCITVICDAGGCTGNICGFDEPRWFAQAKPIFSAGLRDMDAILGRDDRLVGKLKLVAEKVDADFAAIIGTPVPAVIATDFRALKRMAEKRCGLPVVTVECTGTRLYDRGEEDAYLELLETFATAEAAGATAAEGSGKKLGVFGATPLDLSSIDADKLIREKYQGEYDEVFVYGMGDGKEALSKAASNSRNLVISTAGIKAAEYLKEKYGTEYEIYCPIIPEEVKAELGNIKGAKVLVLQQQVAANTLRNELEKNGNEVSVASFFEMKDELMKAQDVRLETEEDYCRLIEEGGYDIVIGDELFRRAVPEESYGRWIRYTHFAVSGNLEERLCVL